MIKIVSGTRIDRPSEEVFAYIPNFENNPKWQSGMVAAKFTSEGPLRVGSTYSQQAKFLGRNIESTFEVLEYEPDRMVRAATTAGSFPITFTRVVEPIDGGTKVTAIIEGEARGFFKLAKSLMARMVQRSVDADYENLKRILEGEGMDG